MKAPRKGYRRPDDNAVMVEVRPNQYVNLKDAMRLGMVESSEKIDVKTD